MLKSTKNLTDAERARTAETVLANLQTQQESFTKLHAARDVLSHKIAKNSKPFLEGEFVK